tara:strand:- start:950 stop:1942 length:993 start_codon:yes stop_codon:yes gene_type:complete
MAYRETNDLEVPSDMKLSRLSTPSQISSYIKKLIKATQYDYRESEALEVSEVLLNNPENRDSIRGTFIVSGEDPGIVKSLMPHITAVPVVGEHVVCTEYNGQYYYTSIINRKSSINENAISGVATNFKEDVKFGKSFERKKVRPLEIGEGCILFEGRFGQSIHLDGHQNKSSIKISSHDDEEKDGAFRKEKIDNDDASIYLLSRGMSDKFDGQNVKGKKVLIKSNGIFISGDDVRLGSSVDTEIEPVVLGNKLKELLDEVFTGTITQNNTTIAANTAKLATLAAIQPPTPQTLEEIKSLTEQNVELGEINYKLQTAITTATYLSSKVKTI